MLNKFGFYLGLCLVFSVHAAKPATLPESIEARLSRCMQEEVTFIPVSARVNLNTASVAQIRNTVRGIGEKRAEAIVAYRDAHGAFRTWQDLAKVKGLGGRFVESHREELEKHFILG